MVLDGCEGLADRRAVQGHEELAVRREQELAGVLDAEAGADVDDGGVEVIWGQLVLRFVSWAVKRRTFFHYFITPDFGEVETARYGAFSLMHYDYFPKLDL